jgi:hypothetical protein
MATFILFPRVEKLVCLSGAMPPPSPPSARPPYDCKLTVAKRGGENLSALHFRNTTFAGAPQWILIRQDQDQVIDCLLKEKVLLLKAPNLGKTAVFPVLSLAAPLICPPCVKQRDDDTAFQFVMLFAIIAIVLAQCLHFRYFEQEKRNEILMFSREIKCTLNIHCNRKTFQMSCIHASLKTKWQFRV